MKANFFIFFLLVSTALFSENVNIGEGRTLYTECQGKGEPTVILISGHSNRGDIWQVSADRNKSDYSVFARVANFTRVCVYDRPGTRVFNSSGEEKSRSTAITNATTVQEAVNDLHALLAAEKSKGPFILVGHSYGGLIARLYASNYPEEVSGLVLVDTLTEFLFKDITNVAQSILGVQEWKDMTRQYSTDLNQRSNLENVDLIASFSLVQAAPKIKPIPVVMLAADNAGNFQNFIGRGLIPNLPFDLSSVLFQAHLSGQKQLASELNATLISDTHSGHYIMLEQPELIVSAIKQVIQAASSQ